MSCNKLLKLLLIKSSILFLSISAFSSDILNIVTTTSDLSDLVKQIGRDKVKVTNLCKGTQDPHYVEPRPSMVIKMKNADCLIRIGMDLDSWVQSLIDSSRNSRIMHSASGYIDASTGIDKLEVPKIRVDASMGDVHIYGNPHYWLDPENAKIILKQILNKLCELMPTDSEYFKKNYKEYLENLESTIIKCQTRIKQYRASKIVTYHNTWLYFANRFGLEIIGQIEPKPGIPPNPSHIISLVEKMKKEKVKVIVAEPYLNVKIAEKIANDAFAKVLVLPASTEGIEEVKTYLELFEYNIDRLVEALKE